MAAAGGLPPAALALPVSITIGYAFMLPMNTVPNLIMLEAGYFSARETLGYGTILTVAAAAVLLLLAAVLAGARNVRRIGLVSKGPEVAQSPARWHWRPGAATRNLITDPTRVDAAGGMNVFKDRRDAGRQLGRRLSVYATLRPVVVALPRGGVPVAAEIADRLDAPLDVIVVRKIGLPWQPELAIGAIAEGNVCVVNDALLEETGVSGDELEAAIARERVELERRVRAYRGERSPLRLDGRVVILVDDGLATGYTARAAIAQIRRRGAGRVVLAVPVAPEDIVATMDRVADEFVVLQTPPWFFSIGEHYEDFRQTSDDEVVACLQRPANPAMGQVA
jgi:putative phosphoribosyl transferase